jgi:hypothetical protein
MTLHYSTRCRMVVAWHLNESGPFAQEVWTDVAIIEGGYIRREGRYQGLWSGG